MTDPLIALGAEADAIEAREGAPEDVGREELSQRLVAVQDRIAGLVPLSPAGAVVQLRLLRGYLRDFEWGEYADQIAGNLMVGLRRLAGGPS